MSKISISRVISCIWGQSVGDAIGLGTEFMTKEQVKKYYHSKPYTYNDIVQDDHRSSWEKGDWTDDTDHMFLVMDTIMNFDRKTDRDYSTKFAKLLTNWRQNGFPELGDKFGGVGLGKPVAWVMNEECFTEDPKRAARIVWDDAEFTENGSLMKISLMGTLNKPLEEVIDITVEICLATHADPRCVGACVFLVVAVYHFVREEEAPVSRFSCDTSSTTNFLDIEKVTSIAREKAIVEMKKLEYCRECHITKFNSYFENIESIEYLQLDRPHVRSTIKQTFRCVVYTLQQVSKGKKFEDIMWDIVLEGGDADTNAAICCSLMGSYFGEVPQHLIDGLKFKKFMSERIQQWISYLKAPVSQLKRDTSIKSNFLF